MRGQTIILRGQDQEPIMERNRLKICKECGKQYEKDPRDSWKYFLNRRMFCSKACADIAWPKKAARRRKPMAQVFAKWFDQTDGCWIWKGATDRNGYGAFSYAGKMYKAHRVALQLNGVEIGAGMYACHKCNNPSCVNPDHLYAGTPKQNSQDKIESDRQPKGADIHCAKLTDNDVRAIRKSRRDPRAIAERYGVSPSNIKQILSGKTWRHVE